MSTTDLVELLPVPVPDPVPDLSIVELRDTIEAMNKHNQIEALRIFTTHGVTVNENKYGIHINLSEVSQDILITLNKFVQYIHMQEKTIDEGEKQKDEYKRMLLSSNP